MVEDEEALRELARRLLERQGYHVFVAADARDAFRLVEAHPSIDLLLTDIVMPGISGPELTRQLVERRPDLKVLYMSGYTDESILQRDVPRPGSHPEQPFSLSSLRESAKCSRGNRRRRRGHTRELCKLAGRPPQSWGGPAVWMPGAVTACSR